MTTREYAEAIMVWRDPDIADVEDIINAAVEEEREACRKIAAGWMRLYDPFTDPRSRVALEISEAIAARSNPAE